MKDPTAAVMERCDLLANISGERGLTVRSYGSRAMNEANSIVAGWMKMAGMTTGRDEIGNLTGRYDGILGVLCAIACVQLLHDAGERLPFAVEVVAFADEEGLRFGTTFLGSSVYAGRFDRRRLELEDGDGVTLMEAVRVFGGDPFALEVGGRDPEDLIGYCELHIEQDPVLEELDLPIGVVTAINGQSRIGVRFTGKAGHAGTVPMENRKDALCAAAEFILEARRCARAEPPAVATIGEIKALPGAINVVPGEARFSLDLRHPDDAARERLRDHLEDKAGEIAAANDCSHGWLLRQETNAVPADPGLSDLLAGAVEEVGSPSTGCRAYP